MTDKSEPAFPTHSFTQPSGDFIWPQNGLTKREWFAGMALQGFLAANQDIQPAPGRTAEIAFKYADAMLAESGNS